MPAMHPSVINNSTKRRRLEATMRTGPLPALPDLRRRIRDYRIRINVLLEVDFTHAVLAGAEDSPTNIYSRRPATFTIWTLPRSHHFPLR